MRIDVFKRTNDDWYPPYRLTGEKEQRLVEVSFMNLSNGEWRVCAWGGDDMGLERDYSNEGEAFNVFLQIIGKEYVDTRMLIQEFTFHPA